MNGTVEEFTVNLTKHREAFEKNADLLIKGFCQTLFNEIQSGGRYSPGTPIDTGFARANWHGGIGAEGPAPTGTDVAASQAQLAETAQAAKVGDVVILANNAPYINRLEFGFIGTDSLGRFFTGFGPRSVGGRSSQAPEGFVRLALMHVQDIGDEVAAHVMAMQ